MLASSCGLSNASTSAFGRDTPMGQIQHRGVLRVGVERGEPPFASGAPGGPARGFVVGWARVAARALGVRMQVTAAPTAQLVREVDSGGLDMAFPDVAITEAELRPPRHPGKAGLPGYWPAVGVQFADPYFVGHQRLLVPADSPVRQVRSLGARPVCSVVDPATEVPVRSLDRAAKVITRSDPAACVGLLRSGKVAAATSSGPGLLEMMARLHSAGGAGFRIAGDQLSTEGYGVMIAGAEVPGWLSYLNQTYGTDAASATWTRLYRRWIAPYQAGPATPPTMTSEEAAALFPM